MPEDYAERAADIIERLTPLGVRFCLPMTVGREAKTPTRLSDDEWNERMLRALTRRIDLKTRTDIFGVIHLYSRGVGPNAIGQQDSPSACQRACRNAGYDGYKCGSGDVTWD